MGKMVYFLQKVILENHHRKGAEVMKYREKNIKTLQKYIFPILSTGFIVASFLLFSGCSPDNTDTQGKKISVEEQQGSEQNKVLSENSSSTKVEILNKAPSKKELFEKEREKKRLEREKKKKERELKKEQERQEKLAREQEKEKNREEQNHDEPVKSGGDVREVTLQNGQEISVETGIYWQIQGEDISYDVSNQKIAEIVERNGVEQIKFNRPGDVYVTAYIPVDENTGRPAHVTYLAHVSGKPVDETAVNMNTYEREILYYVNQEREKVGAPPLRLARDSWRDAANLRANEIVELFSHERPNGEHCNTAVPRDYSITGENLAEGATSTEEVMEGWMNSKGHRENILNPEFEELAVGYVYDGDTEFRHYWVQLFRKGRE